jgi:rhomboid protease GluP
MPAILCPRCRKLIGSQAPSCPFCGLRRPGLLSVGTTLRRLAANADLSLMISCLCVGLYVLALLADPAAVLRPRGLMGILAPSSGALQQFGATGTYPVRLGGRWWTLLTAIYLHGGLLHILFNVLWVRQLGPLVQQACGPFRTFVVFTVAGVCGFILSVHMEHLLTLGASGSIFGLLAAAIEHFRRTGARLYTRQFVQWALILFVFGLLFPGVDNWAHAGGFAGGYATAWLLGRGGDDDGLWVWAATGLCAVATVGAFGLQAAAVFWR